MSLGHSNTAGVSYHARAVKVCPRPQTTPTPAPRSAGKAGMAARLPIFLLGAALGACGRQPGRASTAGPGGAMDIRCTQSGGGRSTAPSGSSVGCVTLKTTARFVSTPAMTPTRRLHVAIAVCKATIPPCQLQTLTSDRRRLATVANPGGQLGGTGGAVVIARPVVPQRPLRENVLGHWRAIRTAPYQEELWALLGARCCWPCSGPASGQDPCHVRLSVHQLAAFTPPPGCTFGMPYDGKC